MQDAITLYGARESGHAFKVRVLLEMAQLPYTFHEIDLRQARDLRPQPFRTLSPYGEVPLLVHNGRSYAQSNAVLLHLAAHTGVPARRRTCRMRSSNGCSGKRTASAFHCPT